MDVIWDVVISTLEQWLFILAYVLRMNHHQLQTDKSYFCHSYKMNMYSILTSEVK